MSATLKQETTVVPVTQEPEIRDDVPVPISIHQLVAKMLPNQSMEIPLKKRESCLNMAKRKFKDDRLYITRSSKEVREVDGKAVNIKILRIFRVR